MVQAGAAKLNGIKSDILVPPTDDPIEAAHRLAIFETLLTGRIGTYNPLTQPVPGS
jgi:hypothetical protein